MQTFVRGDVDGFVALWLDNLVVAIVMAKLSLGFPLFLDPHLFYTRLLPASATGLIIGNGYYAWQARRLARREGRTDVCALPFGLSIILLVTFVFLILYPAKLRAEAAGLSGAEAGLAAWRAGVGAAFIMGLVEFLGAFAAEKIRQLTPRPALLAALAGIGLAFLSLDFFFRAYALPVVGLTTLGLTFIFYFGRVELRCGLPRGLVVLLTGTLLAWAAHFLAGSAIVPVGEFSAAQVGWHLPRPDPALLFGWWSSARQSLPVVIPLGLISTLWSLQSIESAEAAGDRYATRSSLLFNGVATMGSAFFGSPFLATIYFGHPGWKAIGARSGYSVLNAVVMTLICCTGTLSWVIYGIPVEAGMALITWIGIATATQAFEVVPKRHIPAVVVGLIPAVGAFIELVVKRTLLSVGLGAPGHPLPSDLNALFVARSDFYSAGVFALGEGYIYTCMIWGAATVHIIDRKFKTAAAWLAIAGILSLVGLIHNYVITSSDIVGTMGWQFNATALAYFLLAALCFGTEWFTRRSDDDGLAGTH
jgi:AGZA family xanthine/uracil permease-like MFS transporter